MSEEHVDFALATPAAKEERMKLAIPKERRHMLIVISNRLKEIADKQGADYFSEETITEATTIDDDALTEAIKTDLRDTFPEANIDAFQRGNTIGKLLDLIGY